MNRTPCHPQLDPWVLQYHLHGRAEPQRLGPALVEGGGDDETALPHAAHRLVQRRRTAADLDRDVRAFVPGRLLDREGNVARLGGIDDRVRAELSRQLLPPREGI